MKPWDGIRPILRVKSFNKLHIEVIQHASQTDIMLVGCDLPRAAFWYFTCSFNWCTIRQLMGALWMCVLVCACARMRERDREREIWRRQAEAKPLQCIDPQWVLPPPALHSTIPSTGRTPRWAIFNLASPGGSLRMLNVLWVETIMSAALGWQWQGWGRKCSSPGWLQNLATP